MSIFLMWTLFFFPVFIGFSFVHVRPPISPKVNASAHPQALRGCTLKHFGDFPDGPLCASTAGSTGLISGQGPKIPHATLLLLLSRFSRARLLATPWLLGSEALRSLSGSSVHGIFQARALEWIAIAFSANATQGSQKPIIII